MYNGREWWHTYASRFKAFIRAMPFCSQCIISGNEVSTQFVLILISIIDNTSLKNTNLQTVDSE